MALNDEEYKSVRKAALAKAQANGFGKKGIAGRRKISDDQEIRTENAWARLFSDSGLSVGEDLKKQYREDNGLPPDWNPDYRTPGQQKLQDTVGVIYFLLNEDSNAIKIGWSSNLEKRMSVLQGASPSKLKLIGTLSNKKVSDEKELHRRFKVHQVRNEWFDYNSDLKLSIENLLDAERASTDG